MPGNGYPATPLGNAREIGRGGWLAGAAGPSPRPSTPWQALRQAAQWVLSKASAVNDTAHLAAIGCDVTLREVYDKIQFVRNDEVTPS